MRQARAADATTVVTIFVNPRQFTVADDYTKYPRNEARDLAIAEAEGVDIVFAPDASEVYPPGFDTVVSVGAVAEPLEGAARPGHFDGVATVVAILFDLVGADHAYFGQKDAQQVMVIRQMARDLAIATQVIACPTVREPDGLALSSRNVHLSPERASRRAGPAPRPPRRPRPLGGGRTVGRSPARRDVGDPDRRAAGRRRLRLRRGRRRPSPSSTGSTARRCCRWRSASGPPASSTTSCSSPNRPPDAGHGCRRADPPRLPHLLRGARRRLPVPAGLLPRHRPGARADRVLTALQAAIQLLLPRSGAGSPTVPAHAPDPAAGRGGRDGRCDDPVPCRRLPDGPVGSLILYAGMSGIAPTLDARTLERSERNGESLRGGAGVRFARVRPATLAVGFVLDAEVPARCSGSHPVPSPRLS